MGLQIYPSHPRDGGYLTLKITKTPILGAFLLQTIPFIDERGIFTRVWCDRELKSHDINFKCVQVNLSFNHKQGTLRGMHFQRPPYEEAKIVSCIRGAIYDVIIDLRRESPTFGQKFEVELTSANNKSLYIPAGLAHGFQTLQNNSEVLYHMSEFYYAKFADGVRFDDPYFNILWPIKNKIISMKDQSYKDFNV